MSASIIQLYRLVDIEDPVSVPPPPVPFRSPQKGCCTRSRLFRHGLGLTATRSANASRGRPGRPRGGPRHDSSRRCRDHAGRRRCAGSVGARAQPVWAAAMSRAVVLTLALAGVCMVPLVGGWLVRRRK